MGVAILFHFVFTCFHALAWPLLSMVYPLYASIEATERNSISDTQKLITYWICFAAISLFEYFASVLLEWLPFWAYIKLSIICCLVAPHFDGSLYMYKRFIRPVHVEKQNWYKNMKKRFYLRVSIIILEAKNYFVEIEADQAPHSSKELKVTEITNDISIHKVDDRDSQGSLSIEKVQKDWTCEVCDVKTSSEFVFQSHLQGKRHKVACEVLKSKSESTTGEQGTCSICQTVITTRKDMIQHKANCELLKTQQPHGYATSVAVPTVLCNSSQHEGAAESCTTEEIKNQQWRCALCNVSCGSKEQLDSHLNGRKHLAKTKISNEDGDTGKTAAIPKFRAEPRDAAAVEQIKNEVALEEVEDRGSQNSSSFERVQKEWTCEVCEVRTGSESNLQSHLQGKRHNVACEILKSKSQGTSRELLKTQERINKVMPHGYATSDVLPKVLCNRREEKQGAAESCTTEEIKNQQWRCALCNVSCGSKEQLDSHLNGRKHLAKTKISNKDGDTGKTAAIPKLRAEPKDAAAVEQIKNEVSLEEVEDRGSQDSLSFERVQKEWTCEVCEVRTGSESNLRSHLQGKRHNVACEILKSKNQGTSKELLKTQEPINKVMPHGYATSDVLPKVSCNHREQKQGAAESCTTEEIKNQQWRCALCNVSCGSKEQLDSHLNGRKHLAKTKISNEDGDTGKTAAMPKLRAEPNIAASVEQIKNEESLEEVEDRGSHDSLSFERVQKEWTCEVCEVRTGSESNLQSHLQGKRHKVACEILKSKSQRTSRELLKTQEPINKVTPHGYATSDVLPNVPCNRREQKQGAAESCTTEEIKNQQWRCELCNVICCSKEQLDSHLNGRKHLAKTEISNEDGDTGKTAAMPKLRAEPKDAAAVEQIKNEVSLEEVEVRGSQDSLSFERVQKEWTCEVCEVRTGSESNLQSHLQGKRHNVACEILKSKSQGTSRELLKTQEPINKVTPHGYATSDVLPNVPCNRREQKQGAAESCTTEEIKNQQWRCALCNVSCGSKEQLDSHLSGRKHLAKTEISNEDGDTGKTAAMPKLRAEPKDAAAVEQFKNEVSLEEVEDRGSQDSSSFERVQKEWTCEVCEVRTGSESNFQSHLQGKRHKVACEILKSKSQGTSRELLKTQEPINKVMPHGYATSDVLPKVPCNRRDQKQGAAESCTTEEIKNQQWRCKLCNVSCSSKEQLDSHLNGRKHLSKTKISDGDGDTGKLAVIPKLKTETKN